MGLIEFQNAISEIQANNPAIFHEKRPIISYYALDRDRSTEQYNLSLFENDPLPEHIQKELIDAYLLHLR